MPQCVITEELLMNHLESWPVSLQGCSTVTSKPLLLSCRNEKWWLFVLLFQRTKLWLVFLPFIWMTFQEEASMRLHNLEFSKGFFVDFVMKGFRIFFGDHFTNWRVSFKILEFGWKCSESRSNFWPRVAKHRGPRNIVVVVAVAVLGTLPK